MVVTCNIDFDNNPHGVYFAGQVLTGKITLSSDKVKNVKAVSLNISGCAETRWSESNSRSSNSSNSSSTSSSTTYYGREDYIASLTYLLGSNLSTQVSIEPGVHIYTFGCQIPHICPSSFEGIHGHVRYMVTIALVRPWKFDQTYTRCLTVLKVMDLNIDSPLLRVPAHTEAIKTYCFWPCSSDPLLMELTLPQTGFVPGQKIPLTVLVTNESNIDVEALEATLAMMVICYSQHPAVHSRNQRIVVAKLLTGDSVPRQCKKLFNYEFQVPATPPSCLNLCRIIKICYQVELEAKVKGMHLNEVLTIPVTIGNVPLPQQQLQFQPVGSQPLNVQGFNMATDASAPSAAAINDINAIEDASNPLALNGLPPPNYQEAMHMRSTEPPRPNEMNVGEGVFTPRYPVFDIPSPSAHNTMSDGGFVNAGTDINKSTWL